MLLVHTHVDAFSDLFFTFHLRQTGGKTPPSALAERTEIHVTDQVQPVTSDKRVAPRLSRFEHSTRTL